MSATPAVCPRCSGAFECGIGTGACWCRELDIHEITRASLTAFYEGCLCPNCLRSLHDDRPPVPSTRSFLAAQLKRKYGRRR
ncbi:MAG TPA: cysteine-rich CWC family protein [Solirubrobacteraceae bacterium]|nr:cysteine-rich CWC family protein [Solirubrobacteraceae bacterium]